MRRSTTVRAAVALFFSACGGSPPTAPAQNVAPVVSISFLTSSACSPLPSKPCTIDVVAQATDPDRDALGYVWSGCASGTSARTTCRVDRPGPVDAVVNVTDGHGHNTTVAATATGSNQPPYVTIGYISLLPGGRVFDLIGGVGDPDEGRETCGWDYCVGVASEGACERAALVDCTCLGGVEAEVVRTAAAGTCTVTFTVKDSWDQIGTSPITFDVATPR
jgi:hypothetical protein